MTCNRNRSLKGSEFLKIKEIIASGEIGDIVEIHFGAGILKFRVLLLKETVKKEEAPTLYEIIND